MKNERRQWDNKTKKEQKLEQENNKLRQVIGDLTIEFKKNDW